MLRVLEAIWLPSIINQLRGDGLWFDRLTGDVVLEGNVVSTPGLAAYGPSLGFTANGWVDIEKRELDVHGTMAPAHTLSKWIRIIPLLGTFLAGSAGSGIIAAEFDVKGDLAAPEVSTRKLASVTPTFIKQIGSIFE